MRALAEVAAAHARDRLGLVEALADEARRAWRLVDPARITDSWVSRMLPLLVTLAGAQQVAAGEADGYLDEALDAQGLDPAAEVRTDPRSLSGTASDGRTLDGLLYRPAVTALQLIGAGSTVEDSLASGGYLLDMIVRTQVADAGRAADLVATTARRQATGYVRMLVGRSCSRCVILAGRWYRYNAGFNRHPRCDCVGVPGRENTAGDERTDPKAYFHSLSRAEQDKAFTAAGAEAIRLGADMNRVVNARRGMATAGQTVTRERADGLVVNERIRRQATTRIAGRDVFTTTEAAGRVPRLMPESILQVAGSDRDEALRLLRRNGYLTDRPTTARRPTAPRPAPRPAPPARPARPTPVRPAAPVTGDAALRSTPAGLTRMPGRQDSVKLTRAQRAALREYEGSSFVGINGALRRGDVTGRTARTVGHIDAVMDVSRLTADVETWRGLRTGVGIFGDRLGGDLTGMVWREDAYTSTSALQQVANSFARDGDVKPLVMRMVVPAGTRAVRVSGSGYGEQAEIMLGRGLRMRVVADRGVSPQGVRLLDVEVLGG